MNRKRKGYNWKARQIANVKIENESLKNIPVEILHLHSDRYDESNPLVLPSKKRKTVVRAEKVSTEKFLSKKQKKLYNKIVEKRKKKERRATLTKQLQLVQGPLDIIDKLTSITEVQTRGRKCMFNANNDDPDKTQSSSGQNDSGVKKWRGAKKRERLREKPVRDYDVVGFTSSDSSDTEHVEEATPQHAATLATEEGEMDVVQEDSIKNQVIDESHELTKLRENTNQKLVPVLETPAVAKPAKVTKTFVPVDRDPVIQNARSKLPIIGEEQMIMEAINENDVVIICGETGSGKTTQLPQFLYEAGFTLDGKMIGVTEPRRVAAVSMSQRVAKELNMASKEVSYLIRFEGNTTADTKIKFMTDGVLMKELQQDFLLTKYSAIIIDEAHERSVFTDILIGLLSRITPLRRKRNIPLKLIIMSATLRLSDFTENTKLFKTIPPVMKIPARQYNVFVHFQKRTPPDYMAELYRKACKIHRELPEGGILIFVTGQEEVNTLVAKLRRTFPMSKGAPKSRSRERLPIRDDDVALSDEDEVVNSLPHSDEDALPVVNIENYATKPAEEQELLSPESDEEISDQHSDHKHEEFQPMWVLPLYSLLPSAKQARIFQVPPEGCRLCVVATNIAETSLTIPSVKYVVDCGFTKTRMYDKLTGVSTFCVTRTSQASANQRAGRAGRTSVGHCYRLYSSAVYDEFEKWNEPEIRKKPVDDLLLMMKSLRIDRVVNFPFPSPPDVLQLQGAEKRLTLLGALERKLDVKGEWAAVITPLGKRMAKFPVAPQFAKMLCHSQEHDLLQYTIAIVAALSVQELFLGSNDDFRKIWRSWAGMGNSLLLGDVMVLLRAIGSAEYASTSEESMEKYCQKYGLNYKAIVEARKLRVQLTNEVNLNTTNTNLTVDPKMLPPNDAQARHLRQIIMTGMMNHVARKLDNEELKQAGLSMSKAAYRTADMEDIIFLHHTSVLRKLKPMWIVYQEVYEHNGKLFARGITAIEPEWLPVFAAPLCNVSEPLKDPSPFYDSESGRVMCFVSATFGRSGWQLPVSEIEYPCDVDKFKWLAVFLLEGCIFPKLKQYKERLLTPPQCVFKPWAKFFMHRTNNLVNALIEREVDSRAVLEEQWHSDPNYLLDVYLEWLPTNEHKEVEDFWPPL